MDDGVDFLAMKNIAYRARVAQIGVIHRYFVRDGGDVSAFYLRIIKVVEVVQDRDLVPAVEQLLDKVRADESGATRDENSHGASVRRKRRAGKERTGRWWSDGVVE